MKTEGRGSDKTEEDAAAENQQSSIRYKVGETHRQ